MNGKTIKDVLAKNGIAQAEIARLLGLTPNNLNNMLAKDDVRTGLLEGIAEASNLPISVFYGESFGQVATASGINSPAVSVGGNATNVATSADDRLLSLLVTKDEQLTMAMRQTSVAQEQTSKAQSQMDRVLDTWLSCQGEVSREI